MTAPSRKRALVTGASGFVGANLVRRLLAEGHEVTAAVRSDSNRWRLAGLGRDVRLGEVELSDQAAVSSFVSLAGPQWVFHLAAHGAYSWQADPAEIIPTNALGTANLVEACSHAGCEAFVHAGTSSEYGFKDHAPHEDEALEPASPYAVGKAAATMYCRQAARSGALNAITLRLYSVYGAYEDSRRLIPTLIVRGMRGELPPLVGPDVARDFVSVDDAVDAMLRAADREQPPEAGAIYNVGSGTQTRMREVVDVARRVLGIEAEPDWGSAEERSWDTTTWVSDPRRAERELGWRARTGFEEGFERTVEWMRSSPEARAAYGLG